MAFREVVLTEEEQKSGTGNFVKFEAVGDEVLGLFVRTRTDTANYSDGPKEVTKFIFWSRKRNEFEVTPPTDLKKKLDKAVRPESEGGFGLKPGMGHLVKMKFSSTRPIEGRADPMKVFTVQVDTAPAPDFLKDAPASVLHARTASAAKPPHNPDDIPF